MPNLIFTIICEDIRREVGNKTSIMGIFSNGIYLPEIPSRLQRLGILQRWTGLKENDVIKIEVSGPGLNIPSLEATIGTPKDDGLTRPDDPHVHDIALVIGNVDVKAEGDFEIKTYLDNNKKPFNVHKFYIRKIPQLK